MARVAQMLTQEPIYKSSSIFWFKPILLLAYKLILLIYGDNTCPLILAMIVPKPLYRFIFPLMLIKHTATTKEDAMSLQLVLVECETTDLSSMLSLFNLTPNRLFFTANSFFLPEPISAKNTPILQHQ